MWVMREGWEIESLHFLVHPFFFLSILSNLLPRSSSFTPRESTILPCN